MDYSRLRAAALQSGEDEEAVTVDTRALIDKVLARYSGEWTTLRELIQNAADAQATTVQIRWETLPSTQVPLPAAGGDNHRSELLKHTLTHHTLRRLVVQNNGQPFTKTDWGRLKRIAEGNPDETKIGAFGVGFYSVFADCEEPFVSSGAEAMAFYWKGNALFTRKLQLPEAQCSTDTAFVLDYRNASTPLPNLLSVSQFLATSLTFVALQTIEFWIDDYKILALHKKASPSVDVPIHRDIETRTKDGLMKLASVDRTNAQIDATFMSAIGWKPSAAASTKSNDGNFFSSAPAELSGLKSFFSRLTSQASQSGIRGKAAKEEVLAQRTISEDLTALSTSSIFLRVTTGQIRTQVNAQFSSELERATKKPPPRTTKLAILTSSYDETIASESSSSSTQVSKAADVFSSVLPSKKPGGRIFIGFPTTQTTGAGMHISAPSVIPTVEREAIDLNARYVRNWNVEMLRVAGIMARLAFADEMSDLDGKLKRLAGDSGKRGLSMEIVKKLVPEALHILKTYTFGDSTPSGQVAQIIEEAFWTSYKKATIEVYSSQGVLQTSKVRLDSDELRKFVSGIPVILPEMEDAPFVKKLTDFGLVQDMTVDDVVKELGAKALDRDQLHHFIAWAGRSAASGELDPPSRQRVLDVAVATVSQVPDAGDIITLGSIKNYLSPNSNKIPPTMPIPPTTLPIAFTANIPVHQLQALGWEALEIVPWLRFLIETASSKDDEQNLTKSSQFAVQVLGVLSRNWDNLSGSSRASVVSALQAITSMPTKLGMRKPTESFFPSVKLFDDLPTLQGCSTIKEKFLVALGVRKTIDLDTIFTRLLSTPSEAAESGSKRWSHMELIKYLASVSSDIPADDMRRLRETKLCPAEAGPSGLEPSKGSTQLYKVSELFEPQDSLRALKLRIIQWPGPPGSYRKGSPEGRFLHSLGLRPYPNVTELIGMMASSDGNLRTQAMAYFTANHQINGYNVNSDVALTRKAILPLQGDEEQLVAPSECYTNEGAAVLGYKILRRDLHNHANKFGVARDPPITGCVEKLLSSPPEDQTQAIRLFEYFTTRLGDLGHNHLARLRDAPIVPVVRKTRKAGGGLVGTTETQTVFVTPHNCYIGSSSTYGEIFDFVDFGLDANAFLFRVGSKNEPTKVEIAYMASGEPARLLGILQSPEKYLNLLRSLADDFGILKRDKNLMSKMRKAPWLLGSREILSPASNKGSESGDGEEEGPIKQYHLASPGEIVILDDYISYTLFRKSLLCAPEEDGLEMFYMSLGSEGLGSKVQTDVSIGSRTERQEGAAWLRGHVLERSKLFLHEYSRYTRDSVKHDAKWLEKNLHVEVVRTVALRRTLRGVGGQSHTEKRSAAHAQRDGGWVLYVAGEGGARPDMYQVGVALCHLLLARPSQQAYFFFEPFLKLDLLDLRARGYNVDRILRAKAAEARIAEEERRKALAAEQEKIREREQEWARQAKEVEAAAAAAAARQQTASRTPEKPRMPGSFDDSPETESTELAPTQPRKPKKGLFSNLSRRFGFDTSDEDESDHPSKSEDDANRQLDKFLPEPPPTPLAGGSGGLPPHGQDGKQKHPHDDGRVTSPAVVQQNLLNAIHSTRAHDSGSLFSPPQQTEVKEQATYCDSNAAHNLAFAAEAPRGTRVFVARYQGIDSTSLLASRGAAIARFEGVLRDVAGVYGLPAKAVHIFYDEHGGTIAFNSNGSIFCNLRFFLQIHDAKMAAAGVASAGGEAKTEATTWWWVVLAHELAHNLVQPHNSDHSYYTESFIQQYFPKMMAKATVWMSAAQASSAAATNPSPGRSDSAAPPSYQSLGLLD